MFVHYFQIITNFLFVCQSFSLLTSLLKFGNIGISPVLDEIFCRFFFRHSGDVFKLFPKNLTYLVCLSVLYLAYFRTVIRPIQVYILEEISLRIFLETFLGYFQPPPLTLGKFSMEHPWPQASKFRKNQLGEPCGAYVWAKKGPSFCYFFCIIASTCLKCFKI